MSDERVECPECGHWITKNSNGTLQNHKANPRWVGSKKLHNNPPGPWCPGGGLKGGKRVPNDFKTGQEEHLKELIPAVVARSGLSAAAVEDLLRKGWTYKITLGQPDRWERVY